MKFKNKLGFTLIELLVVVAIIGLLASIVMASLTTARQKGRDARRISDIKSIQLALELYYDANGEYPANIYATGSGSLVGDGFISVVPHDPLLSTLEYTYAATAATAGGTPCTGYHLGVSLENIKDTSLVGDVDSAVTTICAGSNADFSGLSHTTGGEAACDTAAGTAQSGGTETCFDVEP